MKGRIETDQKFCQKFQAMEEHKKKKKKKGWQKGTYISYLKLHFLCRILVIHQNIPYLLYKQITKIYQRQNRISKSIVNFFCCCRFQKYSIWRRLSKLFMKFSHSGDIEDFLWVCFYLSIEDICHLWGFLPQKSFLPYPVKGKCTCVST